MPCKVERAETIFNFRTRHHYYAYRILENTAKRRTKNRKKDKTEFSKLQTQKQKLVNKVQSFKVKKVFRKPYFEILV